MVLTFWINAFIPKTIGTYTQVIKRGANAGQTAVPLPGLAVPLNLDRIGVGYLTDQRSFDNDPKASTRIRSIGSIDLDGALDRFVEEPVPYTSGTTMVALSGDGHTIDFKKANLSSCSLLAPKVSGALINSRGALWPLGPRDTVLSIGVIADASDPLVRQSAPIKYTGEFIVTISPKTTSQPRRISVVFDGKISEFPAFEAYANLNHVTKTLFRSAPPQGNTVVDLAPNKILGARRPLRSLPVYF